MDGTAADEFEAMAADELERALSLRWSELARVLPWGDVCDGFAPSGRPVQVERTYVWADGPQGDILCEVVVFTNAVLYDAGARRSALIRRPA